MTQAKRTFTPALSSSNLGTHTKDGEWVNGEMMVNCLRLGSTTGRSVGSKEKLSYSIENRSFFENNHNGKVDHFLVNWLHGMWYVMSFICISFYSFWNIVYFKCISIAIDDKIFYVAHAAKIGSLKLRYWKFVCFKCFWN